MSTTQTKDERINLRLKHHAKLMLERAASFEGQTVSKFILNSALNNAEKQVKNMKLWLLIPTTPTFPLQYRPASQTSVNCKA